MALTKKTWSLLEKWLPKQYTGPVNKLLSRPTSPKFIMHVRHELKTGPAADRIILALVKVAKANRDKKQALRRQINKA